MANRGSIRKRQDITTNTVYFFNIVFCFSLLIMSMKGWLATVSVAPGMALQF